MSYLNPYIEKVQNHPKIFTDTQEMQQWKGKWSEYFQNQHPLRLEIGTGLGNFFAFESNRLQNTNFLGIEIKYKRLFRTAEKTEKLGNSSFVLLKTYAQSLDMIFEQDELEAVYIYFPDPWPKKKHAKNRLMQRAFVQSLARVIQTGGRVFFKTDHLPYFHQTKEVFES